MKRPRQGAVMTSQLELSSRAALCRKLAMSEPNSRAFWIAEAEAWSRLAEGAGHTAATRRDQSIGLFHWASLHNHNWFCFKGTGRHLPSRQAGGLIKKDPFEEFLDLMEN